MAEQFGYHKYLRGFWLGGGCMGDSAKFDQTLGLIYESALAPERLTDALSAMIPLLEADTCHLLGLDCQTSIPSLSIAIGLNEAETTPAYFA